jgi:flavin-binding protein dodecin
MLSIKRVLYCDFKKNHYLQYLKYIIMAILKVIEVLSSSEVSWEDATRKAVAQAAKSLKNIRSVYIQDQSAAVKDGQVSEFRVNLKITFEIE